MPAKCSCTYTFEKVDCTLNILCNGEPKYSIDLCTVAWSVLGSNAGVNITDAYNGWLSIKLIQLDGYNTVEEVISFLQDCKNNCKNTVMVDTSEMELKTLKATSLMLEVCNIETGEICQIERCREEESEGVWSTKYIDLQGNEYTQAEFDAKYIEPKSGTEQYIGQCKFRDDSDLTIPEKNRPCAIYDAWLDKNNEWVYTVLGGSVNNPDDLITIEQNLTKMAHDPRHRGELIDASPVLPTPEPFPGTLTICVGETDVDAVPIVEGTQAISDFIAKLPELPTGVQYGFMTMKGKKIEGQKGLTVTCDDTGEEQAVPQSANTQGSFTTPYDPTNEILPNGETGIIGHALKSFEFIGEDEEGNPVCKPVYDIACMLAAGDVLLNNGSPNGAFNLTVCLACFAAEPFDENKAYTEGESAAEGGVNYIAIASTVAGESPTTAASKWQAVAVLARIGGDTQK